MTTPQSTASTQTSVSVEHLFTMTAELLPAQLIQSGPQGTRLIVNVASGRVEGARMRGTLLAPWGEWAYVRPDGSIKADVRVQIRTDDDALILMTYNGIGLPQADGSLTIRIAPLFETGDERYAWLNRLQAIGLGAVPAALDRVTYEIFALS